MGTGACFRTCIHNGGCGAGKDFSPTLQEPPFGRLLAGRACGRSRQTGRFSVAILAYSKGKRRGMAGKRPSRQRSTVENTGSYSRRGPQSGQRADYTAGAPEPRASPPLPENRYLPVFQMCRPYPAGGCSFRAPAREGRRPFCRLLPPAEREQTLRPGRAGNVQKKREETGRRVQRPAARLYEIKGTGGPLIS